MEIRSPQDVAIGFDHVLVVGSDDKVYGWGAYGHEDKVGFTPMHIPYFDKYIVHKIFSSSRTCAIVSPKEEPSKRFIVVGRFAPLFKEDHVKVLNLFEGQSFYNI